MSFSLERQVSDYYADAITADKVLYLHSHIPGMLAANILGSIPLFVILLSHANAHLLPYWLVSIFVLSAIRWWHYRSLQVKTDSQTRIRQQGKVYIVFILMAGLLWGSAGWVFFSAEINAQFTFLLVILVGLMSGSLNPLSARPLLYLLYSLTITLPIIIRMFMQYELFYTGMAASLIVYMSIMYAFSQIASRSIHETLSLKYQKQNLLKELQQRTVDLEKQTLEAEKANLDKSRFLASASHDLRQPLHAVNLFCENLSLKLVETDQQYDLTRIRQGLNSLGELLDALLDISRLDANTVPVKQKNFAIAPLFQALQTQFQPDASEKGLLLEMNVPNCFVKSDPILLERVVRNFLSNAIRYTQQGKIVLTAKVVESKLEIMVADTGVGISSEQLNFIFDEFVQLNNPERDRNKGLGLGLAIVRRISKVLEHPVKVSSELGKGTQFSIQVPIGEKVNISQPAPLDTKEIIFLGLEVLIIDNELDILDAMQDLLTQWGCNVTTASSSQKAIHLLDKSYCPEFIISDYRLPGAINGDELVQKLLDKLSNLTDQSYSTKPISIPSLIISGDTGADINQKLEDQGLQLLHKPIKPAHLRIVMTRILGICSKFN